MEYIDTEKYTSSLMFGIQWDLVIRHLSNKGVATDKLTGDSSTWGNFINQPFEINRGKYSEANPWNVYKNYTDETAEKVEIENGISKKIGTIHDNRILLTTGAANVNSKSNVYDLAGNVGEWTLEMSSNSSMSPCVSRGGSFAGTLSLAGSFRYKAFKTYSYCYYRFSCHTLLE